MRLLLDTTILIDILRGRPAAERLASLLGRMEPPYTSAINVEELVRGARPSETDALDRLLGGLRIVPIDRAVGEIAGAWRRDFARQGVTLSQADCLIGAAARGTSCTLATGNPKDFPMSDLAVAHWPVGA